MMNLYEVARFLEAHDNYDILTHAYPDGDTIGSGFAPVSYTHLTLPTTSRV